MNDLLLITELFRFPHKKYFWQMKSIKPRIYLFDWQKKKILKNIVVPPAFFDKEEYKFLRLCYHYSGARGITSNHKYIFIALHNTILVYDNKLQKLIRRINHRLFNGIHEIFWHKDNLYVTCAVTDSVLVMSEDGREVNNYYLGNSKYFTDRFKLQPRELDNRMDYRIMHRVQRLYHINNVQVIGEDVYVCLNKQGSFVKIFPREEIIIQDDSLQKCHNAQFSPDGKYILINDTENCSLKVFDSNGLPLKTICLKNFNLHIDFSKQITFDQNHEVRAGWLRGLDFSKTNEEIVYLGLSPVMVVMVNFISGKLIDIFQFRKNIGASIVGLYTLPGMLEEREAKGIGYQK